MKHDLPSRKKLPHEIPSWVREDAVFFISINCAERGKNQLCHESIAAVVADAFRFCHARDEWHVHLLLLMPDHLHALVAFARDHEMKHLVAKTKEFIARQTGIRWQRDYFDHRLRKDERRLEKAHYIRMNPVRKRLVARPEDWPYVWDSW
ncbi:MAG: transposase [Verrucomicrobia bacterium]|nr:transposase [Verrucomicrobiota bacterium]